LPNGHRRELAVYGLPLPTATGGLGVRTAKIPQILSRLRLAQPQPPPEGGPPLPRIRRRQRNVPIYQTGVPREIMGLIQHYARGRRTVTLRYTKITTGETVDREVEPYSIRIKNTRVRGRARYFYAFCLMHQTISMFLIDNIQNIKGTNRRYVPRWRIEF